MMSSQQIDLIKNDQESEAVHPPPRCRHCGKILRSAKSIAAGIGPVCLRREQLAAGKVKRSKDVKGQKWVFDPDQLLLFQGEAESQ